MWIGLSIILAVLVALLIFYSLPYSKTTSEFQSILNQKIAKISTKEELFSEDDMKGLPPTLQNYFHYCGYLGTPKMSYQKLSFSNVDFMMSPKKKIEIDYTQCNFVEGPERFALIQSSLFGIPFEGLDSFQTGIGSMKGVISKCKTIFDQRGVVMDRACLVTVLAESLVVPNIALQDYITWESIDDTHVKGTITNQKTSASGVFTFNEQGAMLSFRTKDRMATAFDGTETVAEWTALCGNYKEVKGIKKPTTLQSIWHYPEGDLLYFNGSNITYHEA